MREVQRHGRRHVVNNGEATRSRHGYIWVKLFNGWEHVALVNVLGMFYEYDVLYDARGEHCQHLVYDVDSLSKHRVFEHNCSPSVERRGSDALAQVGRRLRNLLAYRLLEVWVKLSGATVLENGVSCV